MLVSRELRSRAVGFTTFYNSSWTCVMRPGQPRPLLCLPVLPLPVLVH